MAAAGALMPRRGRPPLPQHERLHAVMNIRTTDGEYASHCRAARAARLSVHEYVRRLIQAARAAGIVVTPKIGNEGEPATLRDSR